NLGKALPSESNRARRIATDLRKALSEIKALSRGLIPVEVGPEGLMVALRDLAARVNESPRVTCNFECRDAVHVDDTTIATNIYRIAQEAVTNALTHAKPKNIRIQLSCDGETCAMKVIDDGVGVAEGAANHPGMGLNLMRFRAGLINAMLRIESAGGR